MAEVHNRDKNVFNLL